MAEYNMTRERYTIGRLQDNDVRIDNAAVSGHHSLIINILNDSFLEDLNSTNGTYVNGKLIKKHALQHGDVITVGRHQLRFVDSVADEDQDEFTQTMVIGGDDPPTVELQTTKTPSSAAAGKTPMAVGKIQVLNGRFTGKELTLSKAVTTLGQSGVQVIAITRRAEGYHVVEVENSGSQNAPSVNGEPLAKTARKLNDNDVVELIGIKMGFFLE
jgi:pSer/pThr/pTyr-binding forkhead associated (FHA) protein